jgi:hypothetical protein
MDCGDLWQGASWVLDADSGGPGGGRKVWNLRDRKEAQRRFHSLLTNKISKRYQCGVIVTHQHESGGLHFHLAIVTQEDIRGNIDFAACFPPEDKNGKRLYPPNYSFGNPAIKREWAFWRRISKGYGFGRHELQPMPENRQALGRYMGRYLSKDWDNRLPEDKGARCVRYFGHWSKDAHEKGEAKIKPPHKCRFSCLTPRAKVWREMVKQVITVLNYNVAKLTPENIKDKVGPKWAWKKGKLFGSVGFVGEWMDETTRKAIAERNLNVRVRWLADGGDSEHHYWWHVTEITLDHLRVSPQWIQEAKICARQTATILP